MTNLELIEKVESLKEWQALLTDAQEQVETIKDELKHHLDSLGVESLEVSTYGLRWTSVTTNRIDTGLLRKTLPDVAAQFTRASISRRFSIT